MDYIILVRCDGGLLGRTLLERGPCWLGLFAGHGAHGAGACRALSVEAEFRHCGQPGHHARTCPLNRQGTAEAAHPHACFSKGYSYSSTAPCTPQQHLWGSKTHTGMPAHTHTCARTHTHAHTNTNTNARTNTHARVQTHRHTREHTYTRTNTGTHARAHTYTHVHVCTHTCTHTCICTNTLRV